MRSLLGARPNKLERTISEIFITETPHSHRLPHPSLAELKSVALNTFT